VEASGSGKRHDLTEKGLRRSFMENATPRKKSRTALCETFSTPQELPEPGTFFWPGKTTGALEPSPEKNSSSKGEFLLEFRRGTRRGDSFIKKRKLERPSFK